MVTYYLFTLFGGYWTKEDFFIFSKTIDIVNLMS